MGNKMTNHFEYPDKMGNKLPKWKKKAKEDFDKFKRGQIDPEVSKKLLNKS